MNTYGTTFFAKCPSNGVQIRYSLEICSPTTIPVEAITSVCSSLIEGYHEVFADRLVQTFGGQQRLVADHHGVRITTVREGPAMQFTMATQGAA